MSLRYFAFVVVMWLGLAPPVLAGLNDGLVAYYPFDGNADDESGNGNDGTVHGATLTVDRFGKANNAYSFDGVNDYILIPQSDTLRSLENLTIAYWIKYYKPISGGGDVSVTITNDFEGLHGDGFFTYAGKSGIGHYLGRWADAVSVSVPLDATEPLSQQQFVFVVFSASADTIRSYKNGELVEEKDRENRSASKSNKNWFIGQSGLGKYYLNGYVDDLRIYNRALSESEIQALNTNANFTTDKTSGEPPLTVQFTETSTTEEPITSWAWDFDNDGTIESTVQHPTYTYNQKGLYSASLTVSDGENEHTITKNDLILVYDALLALNIPVQNTFTKPTESHYYKIDLAPGNSIRLSLDDADHNDNLEFYVKRGSFPSRTDYDYQSTSGTDIIIPIAQAGDWYVLVYSAEASDDYQITAHQIDVGINNINPQSHGKAANVPLTITGFGFKPDSTVILVADDATEYSPTSISVDSVTQITAAFDLTNMPIGKYDIKVTTSFGEFVMEKGFELIEGDEAKLETNLILPGVLGRHAVATLYVEYKNSGNISMPAPLLVLRSADEDNSDKPILTLDYSKVVQNLWTSTMPKGASHAIQFLADGDDDSPGVLQPGESGRVPVYYTGLLRPWNFSDNSVEFEIRIIEANNETTVDWASRKDEIKPDNMTEQAWDIIFSNFSNAIGETWGDYVTVLSENAIYLKQHGNQKIRDIEKLFQFELSQAIGFNPLVSLANNTDIVIEAPGFPITFSRYFSSTLINRHQDNPLGKGWTHSWQTHLTEDADGNVIITNLNTRRTYQPDSRGGYFAPQGDYSELSKNGTLFTLTYPDGTVEKFRANGELDYIEDLNGNRITTEYTGELLTRLLHSAGQFLELTYHGSNIATITDGTLTVSFTHNAGQLASVTDIFGKTTHYTYHSSPQNALKSISYPDNTQEGFQYDANKRLRQIDYNNQPLATFSYDQAGTVTMTANADSSVQQFFYGAGGELIKYKDPRGHITSSEFNSDYQITKIIRPDGLSASIGYDRAGNANRLTDSLGQVTTFDYGSFDRMIAITDAKAHTSDYNYEAKGNLESISYPDSTAETYLYDTQGNITQSTNRRGTPITYTYDANGLVIRKTYQDSSADVYTYNEIADLTSVTDPSGVTAITYHNNHLLKRISYPSGRFLAFTYDSAGRRITSVDQLGYTLNYAYNDKGLLESISQGANPLVQYSYDQKLRLTRKALGNGVYTTYEYDLSDNLTQLINYATNDTVLSRFSYTYDELNKRKTMSTLDGDWTYSYDVTGQLTQAEFVSDSLPNKSISYVYDAVGNRIQEIVDSVTTNYTTNEMNQYEQVGNTTYSYDDDGNLISKTKGGDTWTYSYNDENRLVSTTSPDGIISYQYDGLGNLTATTKNGVTTHYMLDPTGFGNVVGEYDDAGNLITRYTHGFGLLSNNDHFYSFDGNGNTVGLTNAASEKVNHYVYEPFGQTLHRTETVANDFEFVGQFGVMQAGDDLVFMRNRFYVGSLGRFLSEDPIGLNGEDVNLYRYVGNDPVNWIDPTGTFRLGKFLWGLGRVIGAATVVVGATASTSGIGAFLAIQAAAPVLVFGMIDMISAFSDDDVPSLGEEIIKSNNPILAIYPPAIAAVSYHIVTDSILNPEWWKDFPRGDGDITGTASSVDPNELTGPKGYGDAHYIPIDQLIAYRIDFENDKEASAPAQQVDITNQLDKNIDPSTFQLTEIGFGEELISVQAENGQAFETKIPQRYKDTDFEVHIKAGINQETGEIYAHFYSLLPDSELPPPVDIGFLPPEDDTGRGMGHINYTINHKKGLADNTEIRNIAKIVFDLGEVIYTNQIDPHDPSQGTDPEKEALVTIDALVPQSAVEPLPKESSATSFSVYWNGTDGASGIATYDIYKRELENGEWQLWVENTTDTSATFYGDLGHTYEFYSMATDNVGHQEQKQPVAETQTVTIKTDEQTCPTNGLISVTCYGEGKTLTDVTLAANITITNATLEGTITGDVNAPAQLVNVEINDNSHLSGVILTDTVTLGENVQFGENVEFTALLPALTPSTDCATLQENPIDLSKELFETGKSILAAINALPILKDNNWILSQETNCGALQLTIDAIRFAVQPLSVTSTKRAAAIEVLDQQRLRFITDTGLMVLTHPAMQAPGTLQNSLAEFGLPEATLQENGNLRIPMGADNWISTRPDWLSLEQNEDRSDGIFATDSPYLSGVPVFYVRFTDNKQRQQLLYSALALPEELYSYAQSAGFEVTLEPYGLINVKVGEQAPYGVGVVDYLVTKGTPPVDGKLQIQPITDVNGDGKEDFMLIYPNGDRQTLFLK